MKTLFIVLVALASVVSHAEHTNSNSTPSFDALFRAQHDAITWGLPGTNGIQLGLAIFLTNRETAKRFTGFAYLYSTNFCPGLVYPPHGYRLNWSLRSVEGKSVKMTKFGEALAKPVGTTTKIKMQMEKTFRFLAPNRPVRYDGPFNILQCFAVGDKYGSYILSVSTTVYKAKSDGWLYPIVVPPASIQISITKAEVDRFEALKD